MHKGKLVLHNHPAKEKELGVDINHVIIDRDEWLYYRDLILNGEVVKREKCPQCGSGIRCMTKQGRQCTRCNKYY